MTLQIKYTMTTAQISGTDDNIWKAANKRKRTQRALTISQFHKFQAIQSARGQIYCVYWQNVTNKLKNFFVNSQSKHKLLVQ